MENAIRVSFSVLLALPIAGTAEVRTLVIGEGGVDWAESIEQTLGLDRGLAADGLQPVELDPSVNINVGPLTESGQFTNIFGGVWGRIAPTLTRSVSIAGGRTRSLHGLQPPTHFACGLHQTLSAPSPNP